MRLPTMFMNFQFCESQIRPVNGLGHRRESAKAVDDASMLPPITYQSVTRRNRFITFYIPLIGRFIETQIHFTELGNTISAICISELIFQAAAASQISPNGSFMRYSSVYSPYSIDKKQFLCLPRSSSVHKYKITPQTYLEFHSRIEGPLMLTKIVA